jgi:hypothetical protein
MRVVVLLFLEAMLLLIDYSLACLSPTFFRKLSTSTHRRTNRISQSVGMSRAEERLALVLSFWRSLKL